MPSPYSLSGTLNILPGLWCPEIMRSCLGLTPKCAATSSSTRLLARFCSAGSLTDTKKESSEIFSNDSFLAPAATRTLMYISVLYHLHEGHVGPSRATKRYARSNHHLVPFLCKLVFENIRTDELHNLVDICELFNLYRIATK